MPKPADFFVGVTTLFAVLVPGAVLAFVLAPYSSSLFDGHNLPRLQNETEAWIVFLFASYLLGQIAYTGGDILAGWFRLDALYDRWLFTSKVQTLERASRQFVSSETLKSDSLLKDAVRAFVRLNSVAGSAVIDQMEAEYKFFRSLSAVLFLVAAISVVRASWSIAFGTLLALTIALALYGDRRRRRIKHDYLFFLVLRGAAGGLSASPDTTTGQIDD